MIENEHGVLRHAIKANVANRNDWKAVVLPLETQKILIKAFEMAAASREDK